MSGWRNPGIPFDAKLLDGRPGAPQTSGPDGGAEGADLQIALAAIDLTTLAGDDTDERVRRLCCESDGVAAVCVFPVFVPLARECLRGAQVRVATVAGGFPHGLSSLGTRVAEVGECREIGADEIDVVIRRSLALEGKWDELYGEVRAMREAAGDRSLKVILATGELGSPEVIFRASLCAMMAGADFVKTSTGKEAVNATLEAGEAMADAIRAYESATGVQVGLKAAGGIRTSVQALEWVRLVRSRLGEDRLSPDFFRIGASGLLGEIRAALSIRP